MAQTKARPPTFVLFASRADQLPDSYRRYLINSLRDSFDLPGVPLRVTIKSSRNPYAEGEDASPPERPSRPKAAKPSASAKPKPKPKAGAPRGRTAKLARPGVKPKRASRTSTPKRGR
jgi:GTP-binding protein